MTNMNEFIDANNPYYLSRFVDAQEKDDTKTLDLLRSASDPVNQDVLE